MRDSVEQKIEQIDALYPPERLMQSKERIRRLWYGEPILDRAPFVCYPALEYYTFSPMEERLHALLDEIIFHGIVDDDFIPSIYAGCHQGSMATLFGAKSIEVYNNDVLTDTHQEMLVKTIEDIDSLPEPALLENSIPYRWLQYERWFMEQTGYRLPVSCAETFGPMEIAAKLMGYELLFTAAYEDQERFDRIIDLAFNAYVLFYEKQKELCGDLFMPYSMGAHNWAPKEVTVSVSMDVMNMLSKDFFERYALPSMRRIADKYGPVTTHSCGSYPQLIPSICESGCINGLFVTQMSLSDLVDAGLNRNVVAIVGVKMDEIEKTKYLADRHNLRVLMNISGMWPGRPRREWTQADIDEIRNKNERILESLR